MPKVEKVSILISKKLSKDYDSFSVSYGATVTILEGENYSDVFNAFEIDLKEKVNKALESPKIKEQKKKKRFFEFFGVY